MLIKNWKEYVVSDVDIASLKKDLQNEGWADDEGLEVEKEHVKKFWNRYDVAFRDEFLDLFE